MTQEDFNKLVDTLRVDLKIYAEMMQEVATDIIAEGFTQYPVFIATEHEVKIGELILDKNDYAGSFNVYASTMEELIERNLILSERKESFIKAYKNPKSHMCVMLVTPEVASVVFYPYAAAGTKNA